MIAICIESSHQRGMGHLFRSIVVWNYLNSVGEASFIIVNNDKRSIGELVDRRIPFEIIDDVNDIEQVDRYLQSNGTDTVIIDKFSTTRSYVEHLHNHTYLIVGIDDSGAGAALFDLHFCPLLFGEKKLGGVIYDSTDYIILNQEIEKYKRHRTTLGHILVTMGGADTYGVTNKVLQVIDGLEIDADVLLGPAFEHEDEFFRLNVKHHRVLRSVPSMIKTIFDYDLLICGGGITCLEANASGVPCVIIATELHEIRIAKWLESFGGAVFAGFYKENYDEVIRSIMKLDISQMSEKALRAVPCDGVKNVYDAISRKRVCIEE